VALDQAFVESGENARYKMSVEPIIISAVIWAMAKVGVNR